VDVEIWSDIVCPWCYIGKRRFERALSEFDGASDVQVTWRSYQLNPSQRKGDTRTHDQYLAEKTGRSLEDVRASDARLTALAAAEGLDYHFERYHVANTFDAHRLLHLARAHGLDAAAHERFMQAQLVDGERMEDPATLVRLAGEVGVSVDEATEVLAGDAYAADVREEIREAAALGCTGVPFFVIDRRYGISGAQSAELFLDVLRRAALDATAAGRA
jgi:predicted DsbA family dithiol-disulfide isomerase